MCTSSGQRILLKPRFGAGPKPGIPVDALGNGFGGEVAGFGWAAHADADFFQFADSSASHQFDGAAEFAPVFGALLAAGLKDDFVLLHRVDHGPSFANGEGDGFLTVNVLAGPGRPDGGFPMPMIGGGNKHGIEGLVFEEFQVVPGDIQSVPGPGRGVLGVVLLDEFLGVLGAISAISAKPVTWVRGLRISLWACPRPILPGPMMATLIRLLGDSSPLAAQMWEGRMKGAEAREACLRKDLRVVMARSWQDG